MVQRRDGFNRGDVSETFYHVVEAEQGRFRGGQCRSSGGTLGQHRDRKTMDAQKCYMKMHPTQLLSVSRAAMGLLRYLGIGGSRSNPPGVTRRERVRRYYFPKWSECPKGLLYGHEEKMSIS